MPSKASRIAPSWIQPRARMAPTNSYLFVSRGDAYQDAGDYDQPFPTMIRVMLNGENVGPRQSRTAFAILGDSRRSRLRIKAWMRVPRS